MRRIRGSLLVAASFIATAELARTLHFAHESASIIWPPTGISLAVLLLVGPQLWPGVAIGAIVTVVARGYSPAIAAWISAVEVGEVLAGYWLLRRVARINTALDRVRDVVSLAVVAFGISLAAAALSILGVVLFDDISTGQYDVLFATWWWGHLSADLVIAPAVLTWGTFRNTDELSGRARWLEILVLAVGVVIVDVVLFSQWAPDWMPGTPAPYYLLPLLLWAGLRFGPRGAATASCATSVLAIICTAIGGGPFERLSDLQGFISVSSLATLVLSAMAVERMRAVKRKAAIQDAALDPVVSIDASGRILEFNPAAERLFGRRAADMLGRNAEVLVPPSHRAAYQRAVALVQEKPSNAVVGQRYRSAIRRPDGTDVAVEIAIANVMVNGEHVITGFIRDLTAEMAAAAATAQNTEMLEASVSARTAELTRANFELQRREELMREAEQLAHLGSFELDLDARLLHWSDELYRIYGRDPASFSPSFVGFLDAVHPDDRDRVQTAIETAIQELGNFQFEERIVRPDGATRLLQSRGKVFYNGVAIRIAGCCQDVTEQRADEEARYRLVDIARSSEDAIIGLSVEGRIQTWNAAAERIFGYEAADVVGRPYTVLVDPTRVAELEATIARIKTGEHLAHYEIAHRHKDGTVFEASVTTSAIRDRDGQLLGFSKILRDITARKLAEDQLKASLREKEVLLREIHHRVKNNLQVISSLLHLQVTSEVSEPARGGLIDSQNRIQSMALVHQQLYQSKDLARLDFVEYLQKLAERLIATYDVGPERIALTVTGPPIRLDVDQAIPCGLIVNELIANAITHGFPDGKRGHIRVTLDRIDPERLALVVADDGVGLPPAFRIETTPTFGLRIAHTLAHQLDGTIELVRGAGTTIRIEFPLAARASSPTLKAVG